MLVWQILILQVFREEKHSDRFFADTETQQFVFLLELLYENQASEVVYFTLVLL